MRLVWVAAMAVGLLLGSAAKAAPLTVVNVAAPAVNCVFNPACKVTANDSVGVWATGPKNWRLQTRTYQGAAGTPGAGLTAYVYRLDLTQAEASLNYFCVSVLEIDVGPIVKLPYGSPNQAADMFVITSGAIGSVGVKKAEQTANMVSIEFAKPVCAKTPNSAGQSSFFFGMAAKAESVAGVAKATKMVSTSGYSPATFADRVPKH